MEWKPALCCSEWIFGPCADWGRVCEASCRVARNLTSFNFKVWFESLAQVSGALVTSEGKMERVIGRQIGAASAVVQALDRTVVVWTERSHKAFDLYVDLHSSSGPEAAGVVVSKGASWVGSGSWSGSRVSGHVQLVGGQRVEPEHAGGIIYISSGFLNVSQSLRTRRAGERWFYSCFSFSSPDFLPGSQFFCISYDLWQNCSPVPVSVATTCFWQCAAWSLQYCRTLSSSVSERPTEERRRNVLCSFKVNRTRFRLLKTFHPPSQRPLQF